MKDLAIIIPIYNEETGLKSFIVSCIDEFNNLNIDYNIILYNDGSSNENTKKILEELNSQYEVITLVNKKNSGHGPTILEGYKKQSKNYKWIFQIDSDNEMPITYFKELWLKRNDSTFLIGKRTGRMQKLARGILSFSSRFCINLFYGEGPTDPNCPFRLIKSEEYQELFEKMPEDTFAPNLIISGYIANKKKK